jgi:uncharacterized protein YndB with AHSA1/START domain
MEDTALKVTTPSDREISMIRVFNAPRDLVFDAWTKPELLKRWLGVRGGWSFAVCEIDLKVGGKYRWIWEKDGKQMAMGGVYREIVRPERIVCTEKFDDPWYEGEAIVTLTLTETNGKTTVTDNILYDSKEIRDAILKTPMEKGVAESFNLLADLLASGQLR